MTKLRIMRLIYGYAVHCISVLFLFFVLTACEEADNAERENSGGRVTAEISDRRMAQTRIVMTDEETGNRTTFEEGDEIRIGWDGLATPYKYTYSSATKNFAAESTDKSNEMWDALDALGKDNVDVYAWYGKTPEDGSMPATGSVVAVEADQTTNRNYMNGLYLSAHQSVAPAERNMHFTFQHIVSRLRLKVSVADSQIMQEDIMYAKAEVKGMVLQGEVVEDDVSHRWSLKTKEGATGGPVKMLGEWGGVSANMSITFKALLIPQTLAKENLITITLKSGRIFTCVVPEDITMLGGQEVTLNITLKSGDYEIKTSSSVLPDAYNSSYSGNRILSALWVNGKSRICVYDKQLDGSWGTGSFVYEGDTDTSPEFPEGQNAFFSSIGIVAIDLYGDYGVVGISAYNKIPPGNKGTFFFKKSATTGRWFRAAGPLLAEGKGIGISKNLLVSGYSDILESSRGATLAYVIDEKGNLDENPQRLSGSVDAFKLQLAENNVLAAYNGIHKLTVVNGKVTNTRLATVSGRIATDGKKVIAQGSPVKIYDLEKGANDNFVINITTTIGGRPVAVYDRYALIGEGDSNNSISSRLLKLYYFNDENQWQEVGDGSNQSFLHLLQAEGQLTDVTALGGNNLYLKGPHAMVSSDGDTYFIENIDKLVEKWLEAQKTTTP